MTVTDKCANQHSEMVVVKVDGTAPAISFSASFLSYPPSPSNGSCFKTLKEAVEGVLAQAVINDDCTDRSNLDVRASASTATSGRGDLLVNLTVVDECDNPSSHFATVRVDNEPPTVEIQPLILTPLTSVAGFQPLRCYKTLEAAKDDVLKATRFFDAGTPTENLVISVTADTTDVCNPIITVKAVDECGNEKSASQTVRVDSVAPRVNFTLATVVLTNPNNKRLVNVGFQLTLSSDACTSEPSISFAISSDEATQSEDYSSRSSPDAFVLQKEDGSYRVSLRSELSGTSIGGRFYVIFVTATDECGNSATVNKTVVVPPFPPQDSVLVDNGQFYNALSVN